MREKAVSWKEKAIGGKIHRRSTWFLLDRQFWPKVSFGLSCSFAEWDNLDNCLMKTYYNLMPIYGVRRSSPKKLRQLDKGFYGVGFPHPGIECFTMQLSKLLTHYGCPSGVGVYLQISMELLVIKLGLSLQPLQMDYSRYQECCTHSWLKTVWEKAHMFNLRIHIATLPLPFPRQHDTWLMEQLEAAGYNKEELAPLNRVRCYQQVIFLSDVMDASGLDLDPKYYTKGKKRRNGPPLLSRWNTPPGETSNCGPQLSGRFLGKEDGSNA